MYHMDSKVTAKPKTVMLIRGCVAIHSVKFAVAATAVITSNAADLPTIMKLNKTLRVS